MTDEHVIVCLGEFIDEFPNYEWLEDRDGFSRYSNGLEEGTEYESAWFCQDCELIGHPFDGCENCQQEVANYSY